MLGYFDLAEAKEELMNYLKMNDNYPVKFAVQSMLKQNLVVNSKIIYRLASDPETRNSFYNNLCVLNKENLFPEEFKTQSAFAESDMIGWLLFV